MSRKESQIIDRLKNERRRNSSAPSLQHVVHATTQSSAREPWTDGQVTELHRYLAEKKSIDEIATLIGKPKIQISNRLKNEGRK